MDGLAWHLSQGNIKACQTTRPDIAYASGVDGLGISVGDIRDGDGSVLLSGGVPASRDRGGVHTVGVCLVVGLVVLVLLGLVLVSAAVRGGGLTIVVVVLRFDTDGDKGAGNQRDVADHLNLT